MILSWYFHGARYFDPQLSRWHCSDPLPESSTSLSPYAYVTNNPVNFVDPNGMLYAKPSDWEREQAKERAHCSAIWWKLAGMMGRPEFYSGADAYFMQEDPSGGWRYDWNSGTYYNVFSCGSDMTANNFSQTILPFYTSADHTLYGEEAQSAYSNLLEVYGLAPSTAQNNVNNKGGGTLKSTTYFYSFNQAYKFMWKNSHDENGKPLVETSAWIIRNGNNTDIIVLPNYKNLQNLSYNDYLVVKNRQVNYYGVWYSIVGHIHTHPTDDTTYIGISDSDIYMAEWLGSPIQILWNNRIWEVYKTGNRKDLGGWE